MYRTFEQTPSVDKSREDTISWTRKHARGIILASIPAIAFGAFQLGKNIRKNFVDVFKSNKINSRFQLGGFDSDLELRNLLLSHPDFKKRFSNIVENSMSSSKQTVSSTQASTTGETNNQQVESPTPKNATIPNDIAKDNNILTTQPKPSKIDSLATPSKPKEKTNKTKQAGSLNDTSISRFNFPIVVLESNERCVYTSIVDDISITPGITYSSPSMVMKCQLMVRSCTMGNGQYNCSAYEPIGDMKASIPESIEPSNDPEKIHYQETGSYSWEADSFDDRFIFIPTTEVQ